MMSSKTPCCTVSDVFSTQDSCAAQLVSTFPFTRECQADRCSRYRQPKPDPEPGGARSMRGMLRTTWLDRLRPRI